ncbi:MAG: hypothetical protein HZA10_05905 [Nitrospirae bacterium]|nr:hypothetical protein [Nitrospirota bacterium]
MQEDSAQNTADDTQNAGKAVSEEQPEAAEKPAADNPPPAEGGESRTRINAVSVRFKSCGKPNFFEVNGVEVSPGTWVVAESEMGLNLGVVIKAKHIIEKPEPQLKKILRIATEEDIASDKNNRTFENEAKAFCIEKVKDHKLAMKVIATESTLDRKRLIFYFTADERIDFRELVRDLAGRFKTRIEMRQIGVRDEVKCIGGIGVCGRQTCCTLFLTSFEPVSIRMAKKQELALNPSKLSGICGRLMCCLGYECKQPGEPYVEASKETIEEPQAEQAVAAETVTGNNAKDQVAGQQDDKTAGKTETSYKGREHRRRDRERRRRRQEHRPQSPVQDMPNLASWQAGAQHPTPNAESLTVPTLPTGQAGDRQAQVPGSEQPEKTGKGKPFNKRRNFWKKKRR